ncbi:MAG TPA: 50S ribosomal protein L11 methyltransferase [Thauera aminoaromatica]|jgi:ribosomal protein L11 methyltransferase|uniref:Ribosomal protein L11 methyltransferase n=2 Tax=Thauera aminoaromatica TaxID=164330 RepID=C4KCU3_THASP|nr:MULTISPECIES: 50S ribosomal protein L11 methyltransferase [Thauera]MDA0234003.1 50S ribosomal protein L11 methyltransferase [Pseudomonadota bacterium]HNI81792.1 50S ribosomal protein L11 methyltransferase [Rhodocyclaceae bacterium]ACR02041.1 ribosomal protein L11 methyltransferase [Thauera aminoaromatica]ENO86482.1 ribosomal protein L11 methyltransferase [Thauera aminoaromatica S2]KIN91012.1 ribosomal protein L11 methyltransferase [Thauera sp. SWB20]
MWISVTLQAEADKAEALSDALMEAGALSVSIEDADAGTEAERPQFGEPGHLPTALWDHSRVIALFDGAADPAELGAMLAEAARAAGFDAVPPFSTETVAEQNWVQLTQSQFDPIRITDRLWIVPSWHEAPDADAINIELDPGMAFGTGSHPTTRLCLEWLCEVVTPGCSVLDYGCGSGILGIAAAKLGAGAVLGIDIDEKAVEAARDNAARNHAAVRLQHSAVPVGDTFDLVVANILTNPLCVLAPAISARVAPGGRVALSGVLETQAAQVVEAWAPHIALHVGAAHEGWIRLEGRRPGP